MTAVATPLAEVPAVVHRDGRATLQGTLRRLVPARRVPAGMTLLGPFLREQAAARMAGPPAPVPPLIVLQLHQVLGGHPSRTVDVLTAIGPWLARPKRRPPRRAPGRPPAEPTVDLERRQRQVLQLMAEGLTDTAIAARIGLSVHTVKSHSKMLFVRLGVGSRAAAVDAGWRTGHLTYAERR